MSIDTNFNYNNLHAVNKQHHFAAIEAQMLSLLGMYIHTPEVFYHDKTSIIMEYIPNDCKMDEERAAQSIAHLHNQHAKRYGLEFDTTIGPFLQPNKQSNSWMEFYADQRVLYMGKEALNEGSLTKTHYAKLEKLCEKLPSFIPDTPKASLLHGDIWGGNVICHNDELYLIDPALYYGHNEVELAFIMMFDTFGKKFFDAYSEIISIEKEFFEYRYAIYQIYPYLVHIRIYGSSYLNALERILSRFV